MKIHQRIKSGNQWTAPLIREIQQKVKADLDEKVGPDDLRTETALSMARHYGDEPGPNYSMFCYVSLVSAMVANRTDRKLDERRLRKIKDDALAILMIESIDPDSKSMGFLYMDVYTALSQNLMQMAEVWDSSWVYAFGMRYANYSDRHGQSYQNSEMGIRAFRMGNLQDAIEYFQTVLSSEIPQSLEHTALLHLVKCHRLSADRDKAREIADKLAAQDPETSIADELEWEYMLLDDDPNEIAAKLIKATKKGRKYFASAYILDTYLWVYSIANRSQLKNLRKIELLAKEKGIDLGRYKDLRKIVEAIQVSQDFDINIEVRLNGIYKTIKSQYMGIAIDQQLLTWSAVARSLKRLRSYDLAKLALGEYKALSLRLSAGKSQDVLGIVDDML